MVLKGYSMGCSQGLEGGSKRLFTGCNQGLEDGSKELFTGM